MRELTLNISGGERPAYLRIADAMRAAIREGRARPGEAVPSTRAIAGRADCHRHTVMAALEELVAEGWLVARRGQAYRVSRELPERYFSPARDRLARPAARGAPWRFVREASEGPHAAAENFEYRFQSGLADLRMFPFAELRSHLSDVLRRRSPAALGYGDPAGHPRFIDALTVYLRRVRAVEPGGVVVTHGSQEAIFLIGQLLLAPGDRVAVERLGYRPAWDALATAGATLETVEIDEQGIDPESLERLCRRRRIRLLYVTPLHQYPTTATLPVARRMALYEVAARHGVPILEDDYDHEFHYRCEPLPPMAADDPAGIVLYVSTFSKVLYPSARLGFLAAPRVAADRLSKLRRILTRQSDSLLQEAVARWMEDGGVERHMRRMRRAYEQRRDAMALALEGHRAGGLELDWTVPDGGMALWLRIPGRSSAVARAAAAAGVYVQPEEAFQLSPRPGRHLRLGFANQSPSEIEAGLALLMAAAREAGRPKR
ncbi:MAG: PLP-dependent aminotransferase family protein [Candidatus Wallbacteria bacterium]|nr:PLP-dependent aminotransferase family protein [Candidatus Wallbacteria bacterium]